MASLLSRSAWWTATACASRRAATAAKLSGPSEALSNQSLRQATRTAGGIDCFSGVQADHLCQQAHTFARNTLLPLAFEALVVKLSRIYASTMAAPQLKISYASTSKWPFPDQPSSSSSGGSPNPLRIAILDSSFNPPSRAHYALATYTPRSFDAHLLLLSSKNVDKVPGPGDTSFDDRIAMMEIMAKHMQVEAPEDYPNIAVGSLAAATFAEKAPIIQDYLQFNEAHQSGQQYTLIFFIGFDTVTRLFMPKYYGDSEENMHKVLEKFFVQDSCEVICAKRPVENVAQQDVADQEEELFFKRPEVAKYVDMQKLSLVDVQGTTGISSTRVRNALKITASPDPRDSEKQLKTLILDDILQYCKEKGLYTQ